MAVNLAETTKPIWHPFVGAWALGLVFDVALTIQPYSRESAGTRDILLTAILAVRSLSMLALCVSGSWFSLGGRWAKEEGSTQEVQPLLAEETDTDPNKSPDAGSVAKGEDDSDDDAGSDSDDEPDHQKELKRQKRMRLQERGSWFGYLSDFKILIPLIWPSRDLKVQICLAITILGLLADRVWIVLVPRQLGLLTDGLTRNAGTGTFTHKSVIETRNFPRK